MCIRDRVRSEKTFISRSRAPFELARSAIVLASNVRDREPVTDVDEPTYEGAIDASAGALPGGDVTVDEMSDASFPASDSPSRWTWEVPAVADGPASGH